MLKINIFASFFNMLTALRRYGAVSRYSPIIHKTILSVFNKIKIFSFLITKMKCFTEKCVKCSQK